MKTNQVKRQGDVVLQKVAVIPSNVTLRKMEQPLSSIIARGENSNHCHAVVGDDFEVFEGSDGALYVNAKGEFELKHLLESEVLGGREVWTGEHTALKFGPGSYRYVQQVEWHPYNDTIQAVKD